jgi:hypothetical protein
MISRVVILALTLAACGGEIPVAQPKATGYGEVIVEDAGELSELPPEPVDAEVAPNESDDAGEPDSELSTTDAGATSDGRVAASSVSLSTTREPHTAEEPRFNVTRPADLAQADAPLPIIVWANGRCARSDATWSPLFERWASAGFMVLSLSAASQGILDLLTLFETTSEVEHAELIDWAVQENESGPYAGKLDLERIIVAGNACGGLTALEVAASDPRPAGVFVLSGSSATSGVDAALLASISKPVGYIVGGAQDSASRGATADFAALKDELPAMIVRRREGDQQAVSSDARILAEEAEIALNWMDLLLYGTAQAYDALTSPNVCVRCTPGDWKLDAKNLETLKR